MRCRWLSCTSRLPRAARAMGAARGIRTSRGSRALPASTMRRGWGSKGLCTSGSGPSTPPALQRFWVGCGCLLRCRWAGPSLRRRVSRMARCRLSFARRVSCGPPVLQRSCIFGPTRGPGRLCPRSGSGRGTAVPPWCCWGSGWILRRWSRSWTAAWRRRKNGQKLGDRRVPPAVLLRSSVQRVGFACDCSLYTSGALWAEPMRCCGQLSPLSGQPSGIGLRNWW
mmetsp:Transcript_16362/g.41831  ORF Transcript_16362/g.41831 Transcript_16362/m.41831 type:complete len:225 (+) Transcript_16362:204-878(+)